jgi:hypothetical protein
MDQNMTKNQNSKDQWADRGWYLAIEYGLLPGKDRFLKRLEKIRELGNFKELLESGGSITYRNLFRQNELQDAWALMTAFQNWKKKVTLYLNGQALTWKDASQIVWCGGYLKGENPCRGDFNVRRYDIGCDQKINFAPFAFDTREDKRRHIMTFATLQNDGHYHFDVQAISDYLQRGPCARFCPLSPARQAKELSAMLEPVSTQRLGWQVVLRMSNSLYKKLGAHAFKRDHAFARRQSAATLIGPIDLELIKHNDQAHVYLPDKPADQSISDSTDISVRVRRSLDDGHRLRAKRKGERYCSIPGRRDEIEHVFTLETMFILEPGRNPTDFPGYDIETIPENNDGYQKWARRVMEQLRLPDSQC